MRVALYVPCASFLDPGLSGDKVILEGIASGLRERGHELHLVSRLDAREVGRGRIPAYRVLLDAGRVASEMRRFRPDAWLVYTPSVTYPDLFGWWQRPQRYVLFAADNGRPERLTRRLRPFFAAAHKRSVRAADVVGVFRPRSGARLAALGVAPERIALLPPMVAMPPSTVSREEARRSLSLPPDAPIVLCVSRLTGTKRDGRPGKTEGVLELVRSAQGLPANAMCVVVGDGRGRVEVEAERERLGLGERVQLVGAVPNEHIDLYYAACDVFAYPYSLDRPWMAVLEAQAAGRPVVTMRTGSGEATVDDGKTGLLAEDEADFRACLAELLRDPDRCTSMGAAARDYVRRNHSLAVRIDQLEAALSGEAITGLSTTPREQERRRTRPRRSRLAPSNPVARGGS